MNSYEFFESDGGSGLNRMGYLLMILRLQLMGRSLTEFSCHLQHFIQNKMKLQSFFSILYIISLIY